MSTRRTGASSRDLPARTAGAAGCGRSRGGLRHGRDPAARRLLRRLPPSPGAWFSPARRRRRRNGAALAARGTRLLSERYLVWVAGLGLTDDAFTAAARTFAIAYAAPGSGRVSAAGITCLREHQQRGDRVVVATGCASLLAEHVCVALGLVDVPVVASTLVRRGRWRLPHAVSARGEGKVSALAAAGVTLPVEHAYSDSASDLPLLRTARFPHVVDPARRDLERMRAVLGADVDVLTWNGPPPPDAVRKLRRA